MSSDVSSLIQDVLAFQKSQNPYHYLETGSHLTGSELTLYGVDGGGYDVTDEVTFTINTQTGQGVLEFANGGSYTFTINW